MPMFHTEVTGYNLQHCHTYPISLIYENETSMCGTEVLLVYTGLTSQFKQPCQYFKCMVCTTTMYIC